jgi:hypothetical protein
MIAPSRTRIRELTDWAAYEFQALPKLIEEGAPSLSSAMK